MNTLSALIVALAIASATAQFTISNNCKDTLKIFSYAKVGDSPFNNGKDFAPGHQEEVKVSAGNWLGAFYANTPQTLAAFDLDLYNVTDIYFGSVINGFNVALQIKPSTTACPTVNCLGKPSDDCANSAQDISKEHECTVNGAYTITFCPKTSTFGLFTPEDSPKMFLSQE